MKNNSTYLITLLFTLNLMAQSQTKTTPAQATFGRYGSDCSSGRGACSFTSSKTAVQTTDFRISRKIAENMLLLEIKRSAIDGDEEIKIAGKPFNQITSGETLIFIQQQPLEIDSESLKNLLINPKFNTILPGNYQLKIDKENVKILFELAAKM